MNACSSDSFNDSLLKLQYPTLSNTAGIVFSVTAQPVHCHVSRRRHRLVSINPVVLFVFTSIPGVIAYRSQSEPEL